MSESMKKTEFTQQDREFMQMAIDLSIESVANGGGPFGAVIVRNGDVIATGSNRVTKSCDPTAHAEVSAIREACAKEQNFKLEGCTCYTSCEPCPMCLSALYWAGISRIVYGNTKEDAKAINFDDSFIYDEIAKPYEQRKIPCQNLMRKEALAGFRAWSEKEDKVEY
ncbi:MAG: nucleoside deaminase [Alistipes sp.]|nr:nucleoside deaminase [Alistipes sp.]